MIIPITNKNICKPPDILAYKIVSTMPVGKKIVNNNENINKVVIFFLIIFILYQQMF